MTDTVGFVRFWMCAGICIVSASVGAIERGDIAPQFTLPVLANASPVQRAAAADVRSRFPLLDLGDYKGTVLYVDFWDSRCGPCRESLPLLSRLRDEFARGDVEFVAVSTDPNPRDALSFIGAHPVSYPVVSDPAGSAADAYGVTGLPTAYLIARDGSIQGVHHGFDKEDIAKIRAALKALADGFKNTSSKNTSSKNTSSKNTNRGDRW